MKTKYVIIIKCAVFVLMITAFLAYAFYSRDKYADIYDRGVCLLEAGEYGAAVECFDEIPDCMNYKDISTLLNQYADADYYVCPNCGYIIEID